MKAMSLEIFEINLGPIKQPRRGRSMMTHQDVVVVGAGISGIAAGYNLKKNCPSKSFTIFEGRSDLGGTWDLFRYPGIRSDSDMHTLGFRFKPWIHDKSIADGHSILEYLNETVDEFKLREKIVFNHKVISANWLATDNLWHLEILHGDITTKMTCNFLFMCGGYYSYDNPYQPSFPGQENFLGPVIHPQFWDEDLDYSNKRIAVIGSGATAVTLVPALAKKAGHVFMLQRSPTYIASSPSEDSWNQILKKFFSTKLTYFIIRWKNILWQSFTFNLAKKYPETIKKRLLEQVQELLGPDFNIQKHFTPTYNPWDQRICLVPDGDLFESLKAGSSSVKTDLIDSFNKNGIALKSGEQLDVDIIITATGIELNALSNIDVSMDGVAVEPHNKLAYKGMMLGGIPNLAFSFGYVNASWTLRADLTCEYVCRLLNQMDKQGVTTCCPEEDPQALADDDYINFSSGYVQRALNRMPKQGKKSPWRNYQNYLLDILYVRVFSIKDKTLRFYNPKN